MARTDRFVLTFVGAGNPVAGGRAGMGSFIEALELHIGDLQPTTVEGVERFGSTWPYARISVNLQEDVAELQAWSIFLDVKPFSFFEEPPHSAERSRRVLELVRAWAAWYPAHYAVAHSWADMELARAPGLYSREAYDTVHQVYWLNVLGPELVKTLGRERVLSTPAYLVELLPTGSVLLVTRPTVADLLSEEARRAQARALVHLRPDLRLEEVMVRLRERSQVLTPVEPQFEPDMAELLLRIVGEMDLTERPRKVAEFNGLRSPEVDEWRPCESALPPDVERPAREMLRYRRELPNRLLEKIDRTELRLEPATLPEIDSHFWLNAQRYAYGEAHLVRWLAPMAGAFLGEVLVRSLGGCWVPRQDLYETQVLVGDRVYLPFLRAQRCFQSRQAILDYSLTKLYRVAERHCS